ILVPITKDTDLRGAKVSFTSNVIFRVVFWEVGPKPRNSLQIQDVKDPIFLLAHTLQNVTSATIVNEQVRNLHGPSEKAFQAAVYRVMNELLPISMNCLFEEEYGSIRHLT
ncbi:5609_t:CDS:1, partial [Funneliformis geosporum]